MDFIAKPGSENIAGCVTLPSYFPRFVPFTTIIAPDAGAVRTVLQLYGKYIFCCCRARLADPFVLRESKARRHSTDQ